VPGKTVRWFKRIRTRGKQFDCAPRMRPSRLLEDGVSLSRRDLTMVARHEMPGMGAITDPSGKGRYDFVPRLNHAPDQKRRLPAQSYRPSGTGVFFDTFQAFHAWLPSFSPSGTQRLPAQSFFNTSSGQPPQGSLDAAKYVMRWVHFWSQEKFPEGFAEVTCITKRERGFIGP
jgi:hypothetical protein